MNTDKLLNRLKKARENKSLRELSTMCNISYEQIRQLLKYNSLIKMKVDTYNKLEKGLKQNGF